MEESAPPAYAQSSLDRDYWLCNAHRFTVESPSGQIGVVEDVLFRSRVDRPDVLVVAAGLFRRRSERVDVSDVVEVVPRTKQIRVRDSAALDHEESAIRAGDR